MKFAIITEKGIEETTQLEIKELLNIKSIKKESIVEFELDIDKKSMKKLAKFMIISQSSKKLLSVISTFEFKDYEDLLNKINKNIDSDEMKYWIEKKDLSFHVRAGHYNTELNSRDLEPEIGSLIIEKYPELKVLMKNSDLKFIIYIAGNYTVFGVDLTLEDLSKRDYKLINSGKSIKATVGYHMIRKLNYQKGEILVDPNSKTAELSIEAALFISKMQNYYKSSFKSKKLKLFKDIDFNKIQEEIKNNAKKELSKIKNKNIYAYSSLLKDVISGKNNAKVAGVLDIIEFSRVDMDWLDTKFDKNSVDKIITVLPSHSKHIKIKDVNKIYKEFNYQSEYILKPNGRIGILIQKPDDFINTINHKLFNEVSRDNIIIGELELYYLILEKNN